MSLLRFYVYSLYSASQKTTLLWLAITSTKIEQFLIHFETFLQNKF